MEPRHRLHSSRRHQRGTLTIQNGGTITCGATTNYPNYIGKSTGGSGSVTVTGTGSKWTMSALNLYVGGSGTGSGSLTIADGATVSCGTSSGTNSYNSYIAFSGTATGAVTVTGATRRGPSIRRTST